MVWAEVSRCDIEDAYIMTVGGSFQDPREKGAQDHGYTMLFFYGIPSQDTTSLVLNSTWAFVKMYKSFQSIALSRYPPVLKLSWNLCSYFPSTACS
ncbi:hypothetical protein D9758_006587 [Tetrapyrgos nigripes]|uniref:Uncharacterized protein n=1 Tax=Tetrapyrgos nigripes TaxID=182062 RepID=A0A8H5GJM1_9AGAR|nr:hypothetical protein D9758_006587 [Tetrapyrgos nigripes]